MSYTVGQVVGVRSIPGGDILIPALVVGITDRGLRYDVQFAFGNVENIGAGNLRPAQSWMVDEYSRMVTRRCAHCGYARVDVLQMAAVVGCKDPICCEVADCEVSCG